MTSLLASSIMFFMRAINIGLNGFGRIGRSFTRIALEKKLFNITAVNTGRAKPPMLCYLLKYDSVYGTYDKDVKAEDEAIMVEGQKIAAYNVKDPAEIPWENHNVDLVVDATGIFKKREDLEKHLRGSVKKVVLTAPTDDQSIPHLVLAVNDDGFDLAGQDIISNASCTTNCAAPMFKILNDNFKIISGFLTTAHAYTSSQLLLDNSAKGFTRSRAAALSIIPTTTGAAKAVSKTIADLEGKIDAMAIRVPTPVGSFSDISAVVEKETSADQVNSLFKKASQQSMKGILGYEETPLVSSDYVGSPFSCVFDANYTKVVNGNFVKIFGWYDNEWGYSARLVDLVEKLGKYL